MSINIKDVSFLNVKSEKVIARADVHFEGFLLKGFKIIRDPITNKEYITPPSYLSRNGWRPLFKTDHPQDWELIQTHILNAYNKQQIEESLEGK